MNIAANLEQVRHRIARVATREVKLLLATKTVSAEHIRTAIDLGATLTGENKIQELSAKWPLLQDTGAEFHFIGHLQSNKIKEAVKYASCIQSVDRIDLIHQLDRRLQAEGKRIDIFLQVNTSFEPSKFGVAPEAAMQLAQEAAKYDTLKVKGLMTIGLFSAEQEKVRRCFRLLKTTAGQLQQLGLPNADFGELSMGMSGDLETAIEEGATMVRVGTAIFGQRQYADSYYWNEKGA
ncbi:YggS family pyridoxal phosphate-dependent enzyme [Chitinophaga sedimenti]|uniref:YggS family pyridoxal phosphate-dependent enzyme n=1 Tax=Chitinophaga sedimenti TaxID=2033606 RepID=UPI0020032224|nr:YggS family pyridoxal phosphate-dependent enzyme [Chitinophaga sedimenti]MCK7556284.1 YggS family pyridoxal phosphate-dependent enzyme [Chitinophaga sedimenti]